MAFVIPEVVPPTSKVIFTREPHSKGKKWLFSFRFYKQIQNFGFSGSGDKININWFSSLLERFQELSMMCIDDILTNHSAKGSNRYHKIDWDHKNIPIKYSDLNWIDPIYSSNEEEFPLVQIDVSRALGRVTGFWDELSNFNVVLLDPLHNIQPAKINNYTVKPSGVLDSQYINIVSSAQKTLDECQHTCPAKEHISNAIHRKSYYANQTVIVLAMNKESHVEWANELINTNKARHYSDIFEEGINALLTKETG